MQSTKILVGLLVKKHRMEKQLTQQQLADLLHTDRQYVSKIETGKINLTLDYLDKILSCLKCTNDDFFKPC
ncbi:helix-turn-helix transcriptional regulator [Fluviicola sp.]|uniref:helix-turn-helix domain-containing protein n=1 Tax=Fluviicola sp. TaxID=1917219 RepID=UPI0031E42997